VPEPSNKLKIFISWSLPLSHKVALILRDWLPRVIQDVDPWVSSEDIEKGTWWNQNLIEAIEVSTVGIVVITPANLERAWINFEAGALARAIRPTGGIVAPLLVNVPGSSIDGPLGSLQVTRFEEDDFFRLVQDVNARITEPLKDDVLRDEFELKWPMLVKKIEAALLHVDDKDNGHTAKRPQDEILEDVVSAVRELRQDIRVPTRPALPINHELVWEPVRKALESEGIKPKGHSFKLDHDGTMVVTVRNDGDDDIGEAFWRAEAKLKSIPKYRLVSQKITVRVLGVVEEDSPAPMEDPPPSD
jgi:TIR domain